jgi:uncharacterized membrane protein YGL010W
MKTFVEHLSNYAEYHRDPRNILTHLVGVPVIVFAVIVLFSRPAFDIGGVVITPALVGYIATVLFYLRLNLFFGLVMAGLLLAGIYAANVIASLSTGMWLTTGIGLFVGGWIVQFIGHHYEGKKPAFVDDLIGLLIGPLFVTAEVLFAFGLFKNLKKDIEDRVGVVRHSSNGHAST